MFQVLRQLYKCKCNASQQIEYLKEMKTTIQLDKCLVLCDFSQNYAFIKMAQDNLQEDSRYRIWTRSVSQFKRYNWRWSSRQKYRFHFSKTPFQNEGVVQNRNPLKKSKTNFLMIAILPSLLTLLESKNGQDVHVSLQWVRFFSTLTIELQQ